MRPITGRLLSCVLAAGLLHAAEPAQAVQYRISGVVQDGANGYLQGARVFFDMNGNAAYDDGEPSNLTNAQGQFALQSNDPAALAAPVVAAVPVITPKGRDIRRVDVPFTLAAPAGHAAVLNPLTTLVHGRMAATGASTADAAAHFAGLLGVPAVLGYDYVAQNDAATRGIAGSLATILAAAQGEVADAMTDKVRLKMFIAVADEVALAAAAERALDGIVITRGGIFAAVVLADAAANPRNVAASPGEVVVHAGLGYHKTLFDSADNNCQHCHNDVYDTWKQSMHAKSWLDPIFQSKYQDFLRLHAAKIGSTGPTGTVYTEPKFKAVAQTCVRCHAPKAYYSNDFDVQLEVLSENPLDDYTALKAAEEFNTAPAFDPNQVAKVVSLGANGKVYQASYHIGNKHNREGISCALCHGIETVRLNNDSDGDFGIYRLAKDMTAGPIGPLVYPAGSALHYRWDANTRDMNAFFMLTGPEKYNDPGDTPKDAADFDVNKAVDGRYTIKSIPLGEYTGGPYYGPWARGTGLDNYRDDDDLDRHALLNPHFGGDHELGRDQIFKKQSKSLCLACHQRSAGALNPEFDGIPGPQASTDQFMELCTTWSVASTGPEANYNAKPDSPQCTNCHMERLANKVALHKWNAPDELYTADDGVTGKWDPADPDGIAARGYMASHAFVGSDVMAKLKSAVAASVSAAIDAGAIKVTTSLLNKTGHEFPAAHPMRRALTRVVVSDATGKKIPFLDASGDSSHEDIVNTIATVPGEAVYPGRERVGVRYNADRAINIPGLEADLDGSPVASQKFDKTVVDWDGSYGTPMNPAPVQKSNGLWAVTGQVYANKIVASADASNFTRIYGHETGKKDPATGTHLVLPGFDSNIVRDNRLLTNERETYAINFDASQVDAWPVTVEYRVYYMKKGAGGAFPTAADGFLDMAVNQSKKLGIKEIYRQSVQVAAP